MKPKLNDDDDKHSYQLSRRNLIKSGGVAAGSGLAAGGIPAVSDITYPVGRSQGAIVLSSGVVLAAAVGLGVGGITGYFLADDGSVKTEKVSNTSNRNSIYLAAESAILPIQTNLENYGESVGVGLDNNGDPAWINQQSNDHRHNIYSNAQAETALAWQAGKNKSQAVYEGKTGARAVSVASEIGIREFWNGVVAGLSAAAKRQIELDNHLSNPVIQLKTQPNGSNGGALTYHQMGDQNESLITSDDAPSVGWDHSPAVVSIRDYGSDVSDPSRYLDDEEIPQNYHSFRLGGVYLDDNGSPSSDYLLNIENKEPTPAKYLLEDGSVYSKPDFGVGLAANVIEASHDGSTATADLRWLSESLSAIKSMRSNLIGGSTLDDYLGRVYDSLDNGTLTVQDVVSGRQLYQDLQPEDGVPLSSVYLSAIGLDGSVSEKITIATGSREITGYMFVEAQNQIKIQVGDTIPASEYMTVHMIDPDDGSRDTIQDQDIEILAIGSDTNPDESDKELVFSPPKEIENPDQLSEDEIRQIVEEDQQRYEDLQQQINNLDGGLFGGGAGGSQGLILAGAGALAAILFAGGGD